MAITGKPKVVIMRGSGVTVPVFAKERLAELEKVATVTYEEARDPGVEVMILDDPINFDDDPVYSINTLHALQAQIDHFEVKEPEEKPWVKFQNSFKRKGKRR